MLFQVVSAEGGHGVQLVVLRPREGAAGGAQRVIEIIVGIVHLVDPEGGFQAALIECLVVGHEGESLDQRSHLCPYLAEHGRIVCVLAGESVHLCAEIAVIVGLRLDERVERVGDFPVAHHYHTHAAYRAAGPVGGLKIDGGKVFHGLFVCVNIQRYAEFVDTFPSQILFLCVCR